MRRMLAALGQIVAPLPATPAAQAATPTARPKLDPELAGRVEHDLRFE